MRFVNPAVALDLEQGRLLRLDIGSGPRPRTGFYGLDRQEAPGVDIVADLNQPLALLPDNCVEHVFSSHALEHVQNLMPLVGEIHRIVRPGGLVEIIAPHFSNPYYYSDPTHVRFFGLYTMSYFVDADKQPGPHKVPPFPTIARFAIEAVSLSFYRFNLFERLFVPLLRYLVNRTPASQHYYELRLSWIFPAAEVRYRLRPCKSDAPTRPDRIHLPATDH